MGVWIETILKQMEKAETEVTPYVGVWIETGVRQNSLATDTCHSLCGSVD